MWKAANKNPVRTTVSVRATSFVSVLQPCKTKRALPPRKDKLCKSGFETHTYATRRTLCHSSQPFLRKEEEMELETKFCKESGTHTLPPSPPPQRFPNHLCMVPCPWGMGDVHPPPSSSSAALGSQRGRFWRFLRLSREAGLGPGPRAAAAISGRRVGIRPLIHTTHSLTWTLLHRDSAKGPLRHLPEPLLSNLRWPGLTLTQQDAHAGAGGGGERASQR